MNILTANLLFSTLVFWIAAKLYLLPRLPTLEPRTVLLPILLLHSFRHLGLMFLAPGANIRRDPDAVRLSRGIRRPGCRVARPGSDSCRGDELEACATSCLDLQR
jgi:hypothetical protein